eukprot:TRINITY_DN8481_c0_g1_i1.p1 TRINITY_DN8481_c0_g1~~TRINITY_DN8481_c0_g1_i1.p1  ORF type:complete len:592 (+),score=114.26 TRINITY_DN8481_c0_g1_i1:172-1947(+)
MYSQPQGHKWHEGELAMQRKSGFENVYGSHSDWIADYLPTQHAFFYMSLNYFVLATLDERGRPWVSLVTGGPGFVRPIGKTHLKIITRPILGDPLSHNISKSVSDSLIAGLGIEFRNRRRNKVNGRLVTSQTSFGADGTLTIVIKVNQTIGNCPKYINCRNLNLVEENPDAKIVYNNPDSEVLPIECVHLITETDVFFLGSKHIGNAQSESDMSANHRGGKPGFIRVTSDRKTIIWPDYSGNRMFQTLGNLETNPEIGLLFPNFLNGDILYVTGIAKNLFDNEAEALLKGSKRITCVSVKGFIFSQRALNLLGPIVELSPYDPPVRLLQEEAPSSSSTIITKEDSSAQLVGIKRLTDKVSTFTWKLDKKISYLPGQYVILDFSSSEYLNQGYNHMCDTAPLSLNDDWIRSWTISSSPPVENGTFVETDTIETTIKRVDSGSVSMFLHFANQLPPNAKITPRLVGIGGEFSPFQSTESKFLFIAAGVGITPFLSTLSGFNKIPKKDIDVVLLFSARGRETALVDQIESPPWLKKYVYDTSKGRVTKDTISGIEGILERDIFICGPNPFMRDFKNWLKDLVDPSKVHIEAFTY